MVCKPGNRRYIASAGLVILFAGLAHPVVAQIQTTLSQRSIAVGDRVSYVITIDHEEPADVELTAPDFPGLKIIEGPTIRPIAILAGTERERAVEVRFTLEATTAGRYVLPAVPVFIAGQPYQSEPRLVEIGERRNRQSVPFLARWVGSDAPFVVGEARVYSLEIYNVTEYVYPASISIGQPQNAIMEEVQGLGSIEQYSADDVTLYAIPVAVVMITASQTGSVRMPESEIVADAITVKAPSIRIDVDPLPDAVEQSGAVGRFAYQATMKPDAFLKTETTHLTLRVSGTGNLHFLAIPDPVLTGFEVEEENTARALTATARGYEGSVERTFTLRPGPNPPYSIAPVDFVYLDSVTQRIVRRSTAVIAPEVMDVNMPVAVDGGRSTVDLLDHAQIAAMERRSWYDDPLAYGWLVPGLLVFVVRRIWKRGMPAAATVLVACLGMLFVQAASDRLPWSDIDAGLERYRAGDLAAAILSFEDASRKVGDSPGIDYDLGVLYFQVGDIPRAAFAARESIRLAPFAETPRTLLATIERSASIDRSVAPPHVVHPNFFFLTLAVLVNLFFLGLAVPFRNRGAVTIAGILVVLLVAGSLAGLVSTAIQHDRQVGVVLADVTLTRIPGPDADGWLPVQGGAAVNVISEQGDSILVRTALGLEGWLNEQELIWPGSPDFGGVRYRSAAM